MDVCFYARWTYSALPLRPIVSKQTGLHMPSKVMNPGSLGRALPAHACVERACTLLPVLAAASDRIEAQRELPTDVLEAMYEAELFRLTLPRFLGGAELPLAVLAQVTETIAMADASAAWCLGQAFGDLG